MTIQPLSGHSQQSCKKSDFCQLLFKFLKWLGLIFFAFYTVLKSHCRLKLLMNCLFSPVMVTVAGVGIGPNHNSSLTGPVDPLTKINSLNFLKSFRAVVVIVSPNLFEGSKIPHTSNSKREASIMLEICLNSMLA